MPLANGTRARMLFRSSHRVIWPSFLPGTHCRSHGDTAFALVSIKARQVSGEGIAEARFPLS